MRIVKQNRFKNLGELHKEWTEAGVKASEATTHRRVKEFDYSCRQRCLTWAKENKNWTVAQWSKVLFSDESKFCISFGRVDQGPRVWRMGGEAHSPSCLKSSVKFPQSVMIWCAMSSAGVGPLCFLKTNVTASVYQEILEHFMLPSADQLFKNADFIFTYTSQNTRVACLSTTMMQPGPRFNSTELTRNSHANSETQHNRTVTAIISISQ